MYSATSSHDVFARAVWACVDMCERAGLSTERLLDGLSFDPARVRKLNRVPWDDYCVVCERVAALAGSDDGLEDLLEGTYHEVLPEVRAVAGILVHPRTLFKFVFDVIDPLFLPAVEFRLEDIGRDRLELGMHLRPGARSCLAFFRGSVGAIRGVTRHLNLPPVKILSEEVRPDGARVEVELPESRTLVRRATRAARAELRRVMGGAVLDWDLREPESADAVARSSLEACVDDVTVSWDLTRRQVDVLRQIVRGQSNKEIAQSLGCAENTVELHVTQLLRKARVLSRAQLIASFWSDAE